MEGLQSHAASRRAPYANPHGACRCEPEGSHRRRRACQSRLEVEPWEQPLVRTRLTLLDDDVAPQDFVAIDTLETSGEVRPFPGARRLGSRRRRKPGDDFAALADFNRFAFLHPVKNRAEFVPELSDRGRLHVAQSCYTCGQLSIHRREPELIRRAAE